MGSIVSWLYTQHHASSTSQPSALDARQSPLVEPSDHLTNAPNVVSPAPVRTVVSPPLLSPATIQMLETIPGSYFPQQTENSPGHRATSSLSPPPPAKPGLRIAIPDPGEPDREVEMPPYNSTPEVVDLCDDENLSALEKIYLFSRSNSSFHRVFIARSLSSFLPDIAPCDAVEYVIPLMNGLAMDEDEAVKEAFVEELTPTIWWFLSACQLVEDEPAEDANVHDPPLLSVQAFTPLLGTLLLSPNGLVGAPARYCVVNLLNRLREADDNKQDLPHFGSDERRMFEQELIQQVVIGMGRLDMSDESGDSVSSHTASSDAAELDMPSDISPPLTPRNSRSQSGSLDVRMAQSSTSSATLPHLAPTFCPDLSCAEPPVSPILVSPRSPSPRQTSPVPIGTEQQRRSPELVTDVPAPWSSLTEPSSLSTCETSPSSSSVVAFSLDSGDGWPREGIHDTFDEQSANEQGAIGRLASMSLMAAVTANVTMTLDTHIAFVDEVKRAGKDQVYWVRREATFALGALAKVVPNEIVISCLPLFESFCSDPTWNVRQSVLFALPAILLRLPSSRRRSQALKTIMTLHTDPSSTVRSGVLEVLGEVIHTFHEDPDGPPDDIIRLFIGEEGQYRGLPSPFGSAPVRSGTSSSAPERPRPEWISLTKPDRPIAGVMSSEGFVPDPARSLICAFNLPAVALTLGRGRWEELRGLYHHVARDPTPKVQRTLAASIGEMAKIIGTANTQRDLMEPWWAFVRSEDRATRMKVIGCLELFMKVLDSRHRQRLAQSLGGVWDTHLRSWNEREVMAKGLGSLAHLLIDHSGVMGDLLRKALQDGTAAVRDAGVSAYPLIMHVFADRSNAARALGQQVLSLATSSSYRQRVTYLACQEAVIQEDPHRNVFADDTFWEAVTKLSSDRIVDVRIRVARLLVTLYAQQALPPHTTRIVQNMSRDPSSDVRAFIGPILPGPAQSVVLPKSTAGSSIFSRPPLAMVLSRSLTEEMGQLALAHRLNEPGAAKSP